MAGVNKVILVGHLGSDPEVKYFDGGSVVAKFNIATSEAYNDKNGQRVEQTEWHKIELWDNLAKIAEQYLKKGNQVYVEGRIRTETWQDKEGIQRSGTKIRANSMTLLGSRQGGGGGADNENAAAPVMAATPPRPAPPRAPEPAPFPTETSGDTDDLPF